MGKKPNYIQGYAVLRVDHVSDSGHVEEFEIEGELKPAPGPGNVTVKEVLLSASEARSEVERLNELNAEKRSRYYWQSTHVFINGGSHGHDV